MKFHPSIHLEPAVMESPASAPATAVPAPATQFSSPDPSPPQNYRKAVHSKIASLGDNPDDPKPEKPIDAPAKPDAAPDKPDAAPDKPEGTDFIPKNKLKEFRENYDRMKKDLDARTAELAELKSKAPVKVDEFPEYKQATEKLTAAEQRAQRLDEELRFQAYHRSEEYAEKYVKPFESAWNTGRARVAAMTIPARTDEATGEVTAARQATAEDFDAIMKSGDVDGAIEKLFGNSVKAATVANLALKVQDLNEARAAALEEYKVKGAERQKQAQEMRVKTAKESSEIYRQAIESALADEKNAEWFKPDTGDTEGEGILKSAMALVDQAFTAAGAKLTPQERAKLNAEIRNAAAAAPLLHRKLVASRAKIKELEAKLAGLGRSTPGGGQGQPSTKTAPPSVHQKIANLGVSG